MTSTSFNVGLNSGTRNSSKVLKPPGGGSSDIFGASGGEPIEPQRKMRNHLTSSIFGGETVTPARNKPGNNSHDNLFGNKPLYRPVATPKNQFRSHIIFEDDSPPAIVNTGKKHLTFSSPEDELPKEENSSSNEILIENSVSSELIVSTCTPNGQKCGDEQEGNQTSAADASKVEAPAVNGTSNSSSQASSAAATPAAPSAPAPAPSAGKQRVPPGGFSSGLW